MKAKYTSALTLIQLPDGSWVKGTSVRRAAKEENGAYQLMLGVKAGAKAGALKPIRIELIENAKVPTSVAKQIMLNFMGKRFETKDLTVIPADIEANSDDSRYTTIRGEILDRQGKPSGTYTKRLKIDKAVEPDDGSPKRRRATPAPQPKSGCRLAPNSASVSHSQPTAPAATLNAVRVP